MIIRSSFVALFLLNQKDLRDKCLFVKIRLAKNNNFVNKREKDMDYHLTKYIYCVYTVYIDIHSWAQSVYTV